MEGRVKPRKIKKGTKSEEVVSKKSKQVILNEEDNDTIGNEQKVVRKRKRKLYLNDLDITDEEEKIADDLIQEEIIDKTLQNDDNFSIGFVIFILTMSLAVGIVMGYVLYRIAMGL